MGKTTVPPSAPESAPTAGRVEVFAHSGTQLAERMAHLSAYAARRGTGILSQDPTWLSVLSEGLKCEVFALEAVVAGQTRGLLTLAYLRSRIFGRFLVSLPYLNYGGVLADDDPTATALIDHAVQMADRFDVRYLELRNEKAFAHPSLVPRTPIKVHMRLPLAPTSEELWAQLTPKVRNQVRKGEKHELAVAWGGLELFPDFYAVLSHNMRDLGTPVYGKGLFRGAIDHFRDRAEFCVVRDGTRPLAAALLLHGAGTTEIPTAGALRAYNPTCCNMLMYWNLLCRAVGRGQSTFDFGRSSPGSNTARFKAQWGARPVPAEWQCFSRSGNASEMRPDHPRYRRLVRIWQCLPVRLTRWIGPPIVRGIP